jgi:hypothetical protein
MGNSQCAKILLGACLLILSAGWAGCLKTNSTLPPGNGSKSTYILLMDLAPYSPPAEVYLNDVKSTPAIPAGTYSSAYAHIVPGSYDVKFKVAGGDSLLSEIPSSPYDSMSFYTLLLYNDSIKGPAKSARIIDNYSSVTTGSAYYRFIHMCPEEPAVDLYLNGTLMQHNRALADIFTNQANTWFQPMTPGSFSLQLKKAGTDSVIYSGSNIGLVAGNAYTLFLSGSANSATNPISVGILTSAY